MVPVVGSIVLFTMFVVYQVTHHPYCVALRQTSPNLAQQRLSCLTALPVCAICIHTDTAVTLPLCRWWLLLVRPGVLQCVPSLSVYNALMPQFGGRYNNMAQMEDLMSSLPRSGTLVAMLWSTPVIAGIASGITVLYALSSSVSPPSLSLCVSHHRCRSQVLAH